jgi:chemotaxis protein histidine kinase CheA
MKYWIASALIVCVTAAVLITGLRRSSGVQEARETILQAEYLIEKAEKAYAPSHPEESLSHLEAADALLESVSERFRPEHAEAAALSERTALLAQRYRDAAAAFRARSAEARNRWGVIRESFENNTVSFEENAEKLQVFIERFSGTPAAAAAETFLADLKKKARPAELRELELALEEVRQLFRAGKHREAADMIAAVEKTRFFSLEQADLEPVDSLETAILEDVRLEFEERAGTLIDQAGRSGSNPALLLSALEREFRDLGFEELRPDYLRARKRLEAIMRDAGYVPGTP